MHYSKQDLHTRICYSFGFWKVLLPRLAAYCTAVADTPSSAVPYTDRRGCYSTPPLAWSVLFFSMFTSELVSCVVCAWAERAGGNCVFRDVCAPLAFCLFRFVSFHFVSFYFFSSLFLRSLGVLCSIRKVQQRLAFFVFVSRLVSCVLCCLLGLCPTRTSVCVCVYIYNDIYT